MRERMRVCVFVYMCEREGESIRERKRTFPKAACCSVDLEVTAMIQSHRNGCSR